MREKLNSLIFAAKNLVDKKILIKIQKIKSDYEKVDVLHHAIMSNLDLKVHRIETILRDLEKKEVDIFHISVKANLLKMKIKYYYITHHKQDFINVMNLLKGIEKDLDSL